jgi:hypothetical protein
MVDGAMSSCLRSRIRWRRVEVKEMLKHAAAAIIAFTLSPALVRLPAPDFWAGPLFAQEASAKDLGRNVKLADAASITEDLIDAALGGKADKVAEKVAAMRKTLPMLRPLLDAATFDALARELTAMEQAMAGKDLPAIALASAEAYRIIESATDPAQRPVPIEVAMLDYSGFKLSILAAGPTAEWAAIEATAKDSDSNWSALAKNVRDSGIRDLAAEIQEGLRSAVARKDIEGVKFAAKLQLDIVDVLEGYFKRAKSR